MELITTTSKSGKTKYFGVKLNSGFVVECRSKKAALAFIENHKITNSEVTSNGQNISSNIPEECSEFSGREKFSPAEGEYSERVRAEYRKRLSDKFAEEAATAIRGIEVSARESISSIRDIKGSIREQGDSARESISSIRDIKGLLREQGDSIREAINASREMGDSNREAIKIADKLSDISRQQRERAFENTRDYN